MYPCISCAESVALHNRYLGWCTTCWRERQAQLKEIYITKMAGQKLQSDEKELK